MHSVVNYFEGIFIMRYGLWDQVRVVGGQKFILISHIQ